MLEMSRYTLQTSADEHHYFFNTLSGASLILDEGQYAALRGVLESRPDDGGSAAEKGILAYLLDSGLMVEAGTDELAAALQQYDDGRHATDTMSLLITPGLSCNMSCFYCFQDRTNTQRLTAVDIGAIARFAAERLRPNGHLDVTWFGGEPLLEKDFIAATSRELQDLAASRQAGYGARIISNCYHLDAAAVEMLRACAVDRIQVTLDGPQSAHDTIRRSKDGESSARTGSFARIVGNVRSAAEHFKITARVNVTELNVERIPELIDELAEAGLHDKLEAIYFYPVFSYKTTAAEVSYKPRAGVHVGIESFAEAEVSLLRHAVARGFGIRNPLRVGYTGCIAVQENGFVIDANGEVKKCSNDISKPATAFASLRDGFGPNQVENETKWDAFRPEGDPGCRECHFLPVCYSFCPHRNLLSEEPRAEKCPSHKYNWKETLPLLMAQQR